MKSFFLLFFFSSICVMSHSQAENRMDSTLNAQLHRSHIRFRSHKDSNVVLLSMQQRLCIYNDDKDTIYLPEVDAGMFTYGSARIVDTLQLDGKGSKEIVILRDCSGSTQIHTSTDNVTEETNLLKYEIWNLDSKELLFEKVSRYKHTYDRNTLLGSQLESEYPELFNNSNGKGVEVFEYRFKINPNGVITLTKLQGDARRKPTEIYRFIDGKYVMN